MNHPPHATHCQDCGASYVHIEHPLKPGVIMMSMCKCESTSPVQVMKSAAPWLQDWVDRVLGHIDLEYDGDGPQDDDAAGCHYIVKEEEAFEVHVWPAPYFDPDGDMDFGHLHAHLLPIIALFDNGTPEAACFEPGSIACVGLVSGHKVVLLILDAPPDVYEDDEDPN